MESLLTYLLTYLLAYLLILEPPMESLLTYLLAYLLAYLLILEPPMERYVWSASFTTRSLLYTQLPRRSGRSSRTDEAGGVSLGRGGE